MPKNPASARRSAPSKQAVHPGPDGRVLNALEGIPEGFALYDAEDRLVICNQKYKELFFPENQEFVRPGVGFQELVIRFVESGRGVDAGRQGEAWIAERLAHHRTCAEPMEHQLSDGRWILTLEHRTLDGGTVGIHTDITKLKRAEADLQEAHQRLTFHIHNSPLAVIEWNSDFRVQRWSPQAENLFGWQSQEVFGKHPAEWRFVHEDDAPKVEAVMAELLESTVPRNVLRNRNYTKSGTVVTCEWYNSILLNGSGEVISILSLIQDVTEAEHLSKELAYHATHDQLTGLFNRREFETRLQRALESAREHGYEHALCYLDLDYFKTINDTCGHVAGDELLRQLGRMLEKDVRKQDTLARIGGDEFAVLMERCTLNQARRVAEAVRAAISNFRFTWRDRTFSIDVSIGLVPVDKHSVDLTEVLSTADTASYMAKEEGGNRIHVYHQDDEAVTERQGEGHWVQQIRWALDEDRFELYYQPIVPVSDEAPRGPRYELLLRMKDDKGEMVSPGKFLPVAERYHLAPRLDRWVVDAAFGWLMDNPWHLGALLHCAINLSGQSLTDDEFLGFLIRRFHTMHIPPEKICFEVTETAAISNLNAAVHFIDSLRGLGCHFALDDFGSGMSSLAYLKSLPVSFVKIDGAFIKNITSEPIDLAMVKSVNEIAQAMGKKTVAEFVENKAIFEKLKLGQLGVDYAQGYYTGKPKPIGEMRLLRAVK